MKKIIFYLLVLFALAFVTRAQVQKEVGLPLDIAPEDRIAFTLYTVHDNTLKMTAQFYPIKNMEPFRAKLQIEQEGQWIDRDSAEIIYPGYTAHFRVEEWDDNRIQKYRVVHNNTAFYEGLVQKNPKDKEDFVVAAFSCNSIYSEHGGDVSRQDIVDNMLKVKPDILFFAGDQVYDHSEHYWHWLRFGKDFGELFRNTPTITIPDDHDIGQPNLWGAGGRKGPTRPGELGGYYMPLEYVREVERAQTWHLPDPYNQELIGMGIGTYYTNLTWGGISMAIIEDRKFKSGPNDVLSGIDRNVSSLEFDVPEATLLGQDQLEFLEDWSDDWKGAEMKAVLSATVFAQTSTRTGKYEWEINYDFDANGWPQTGRNKALEMIRKSHAVMIGGDQHLASVVQHGIRDWGDAGYSFATPAIASLWLRWWDPKVPGKNRAKGMPEHLGEFEEGFGNKITMLAVANPDSEQEKGDPDLVNSRGAGIGLIRFNKSNRTITFECWPRNVDITAQGKNQFEGWPLTIKQTDNFKISKGFELPTLQISKEDQVVTIRDAYTKELFSTIRINGTSYQPKVLIEGEYDIEVGEADQVVLLRRIKAMKTNKSLLEVEITK